ncbi:hypothetical protein D3C83_30980 [compost metagenome]
MNDADGVHGGETATDATDRVGCAERVESGVGALDAALNSLLQGRAFCAAMDVFQAEPAEKDWPALVANLDLTVIEKRADGTLHTRQVAPVRFVPFTRER